MYISLSLCMHVCGYLVRFFMDAVRSFFMSCLVLYFFMRVVRQFVLSVFRFVCLS